MQQKISKLILGILIGTTGTLLISLTATSVMALQGGTWPSIWPGKTLKIYNGSAWKQSVRDGVWALNQTGMSMHLQLVSDPAQAQVRIYDTKDFRKGCHSVLTVGCASIGYQAKTSWVQIFPKSSRVIDRGQNRQLVMHELGHVLGLDHRKDGCQLMYPALCSRPAKIILASKCPVDRNLGFSVYQWCPRTTTYYQMCLPTREAALQLIAMYGGRIPKNYQPWCQRSWMQGWQLACAFPAWSKTTGWGASPINPQGTGCRRDAPQAAWRGLGQAQKTVRIHLLFAQLNGQKDLYKKRLAALRRFDRLAKNCPKDYCLPAWGNPNLKQPGVRGSLLRKTLHYRGVVRWDGL